MNVYNMNLLPVARDIIQSGIYGKDSLCAIQYIEGK